MNILQKADELTSVDRIGDYGHPLDDFTRTGIIWGAILGIDPIPPEKVGLCMAGLKISRECNRHKLDNLVDGAGYFRTVEKVVEEAVRRAESPDDQPQVEEGALEKKANPELDLTALSYDELADHTASVLAKWAESFQGLKSYRNRLIGLKLNHPANPFFMVESQLVSDLCIYVENIWVYNCAHRSAIVNKAKAKYNKLRRKADKKIKKLQI